MFCLKKIAVSNARCLATAEWKRFSFDGMHSLYPAVTVFGYTEGLLCLASSLI
jgi:hypothetical protein